MWSLECEQALAKLKQTLASPPILAMPMTSHYILDTINSDFEIGNVFSQQQCEGARLVVYA
jgi:RNase H-like domain found in reverse transcriptase